MVLASRRVFFFLLSTLSLSIENIEIFFQTRNSTLGKLGGVATFFLTSLDYRVAARNARDGENRGTLLEKGFLSVRWHLCRNSIRDESNEIDPRGRR